jgi:hypothetical protein
MTVLALSGPARAQGNYGNSPLGGRAAVLGGTGVVLGTDGAAPFLNPATILRIESASLAFSARFFRYSELTIERFHQPGAVDAGRFGGLDLTQTTIKDRNLESLPDTTCFFFDAPGSKRGSGRAARTRAIAICTGKTEESETVLPELDFAAQSAGQLVNQTQSVRQEWSNRSFGPSAAFAISDRLWLGASLFLTRAKLRTSITATTVTEQAAAGSAITASYFSGTSADSWDMLLHLGLSFQVSDVLSAGVALRTPSVHLFDHFQMSQVSSFDDVTASTRYWAGEGDYVVKQPLRLALGIAAEWPELRLEIDGFFHSGQRDYAHGVLDRELILVDSAAVTSRTNEQIVLQESVHPLVNLGAGAEWFVARKLSVLFGLSTDLSALSELENGVIDATLFRARMNWLRGGAGLASYTDFGDFVLGLRGDFGWGELQVVNTFVEPNRLELVDQRELGVMLVLAGRINLGTIRHTALGVQHVVEGEAPEPGPAPPQPTRQPTK